MKNSIFIVLVLICLVLILNLNCGKKESPAGNAATITFWHSFVSSTVPALEQLIAKFQQENPQIIIKPQYIPTGDALIQKLITAIQSQTAPDISWIHSDYLQDLVQANSIYQMKDFIEGDAGQPRQDREIAACKKLGERLAQWVAYYVDGEKDLHPKAH